MREAREGGGGRRTILYTVAKEPTVSLPVSPFGFLIDPRSSLKSTQIYIEVGTSILYVEEGTEAVSCINVGIQICCSQNVKMFLTKITIFSQNILYDFT